MLFVGEPTDSLDHQTDGKVVDLLFSLNHERGTILIMITHDLQLATHRDHCLQLMNRQLQEGA